MFGLHLLTICLLLAISTAWADENSLQDFLSANSLSKPSLQHKCKSKGRFENPTDCSGYIECREDEDGSLTMTFGSCHGFAFDPETATCQPPSDKLPCYKRRSRQLRLLSPGLDQICKENGSPFTCSDCNTMVTCAGGTGTPTPCEGETRCYKDEGGFNGGICRKERTADTDCKCQIDGKFYKDSHNEDRIIRCEDEGKPFIIDKCAEGLTYDKDTGNCVMEGTKKVCIAQEIIPITGCKEYYKCLKTQNTAFIKLECPENELINVITEECEDPCEWKDTKPFNCIENGRFSDQDDCNRFYICIEESDGSFSQKTDRCPPHYHFDDTTKSCIDRSKSSCKSKEKPTNYCEIPTSCNEEGPPTTDSPS